MGINNFYLFTVAYWGDSYRLPDLTTTGHARLPCNDFGIINENSYGCRDISDYWVNKLRWDINGKFIHDESRPWYTADLRSPKFELKGNHITLFHR